MNYSIVLELKATNQITAMPEPLKRRLWEGFNALGDSPTRLSKPINSPAQTGQAYEFSFVYDDMECWIVSVFQYNADEQTLHILDLRWEVL